MGVGGGPLHWLALTADPSCRCHPPPHCHRANLVNIATFSPDFEANLHSRVELKAELAMGLSLLRSSNKLRMASKFR